MSRATDKLKESNHRQRIVVFQQRGSGEKKIQGLKACPEQFELKVHAIDDPLPEVVDNPGDYLPRELRGDLVLDYLKHPDLSLDLARLARRQSIPIVASGKKHKGEGAFTPPTCCGLGKHVSLGKYGEKFGAPEYEVELSEGRLTSVKTIRSAPCGASEAAAAAVIGLTPEEALEKIGLTTQFNCFADPAGWDPIYAKSPVHYAGEVHQAALRRALKKAGLEFGSDEIN